jgi:hypothetical protein
MESIHALREVEMQSDVNNQEHFFKGLFHVFNESNLNYVVLHSWQTLPKSATSDVDMLISADEKKRLPLLLKEVESVTEWKFVQKLWYDVPWCFYYVAVSPDGKVSAALDFVSDPNGIGEYRIKDSQILPHRDFSGFLYRLSTEAELAYKLAKRRVKGIFRDEDLEFVREYYSKCNVDALRNRLGELLPRALVSQILKLLAKDTSLEEYRRFMSLNSPAFVLFGRRWRIKFGMTWFYKTLQRIFYRMRNPTGCVLRLTNATLLEFGGKVAFQSESVFPHFVFRRQEFIKGEKSISWWKRMKVLSSATLMVVEDAEEDGFDLGNGYVHDGEDIVDDVFKKMGERLLWE